MPKTHNAQDQRNPNGSFETVERTSLNLVQVQRVARRGLSFPSIASGMGTYAFALKSRPKTAPMRCMSKSQVGATARPGRWENERINLKIRQSPIGSLPSAVTVHCRLSARRVGYSSSQCQLFLEQTIASFATHTHTDAKVAVSKAVSKASSSTTGQGSANSRINLHLRVF